VVPSATAALLHLPESFENKLDSSASVFKQTLAFRWLGLCPGISLRLLNQRKIFIVNLSVTYLAHLLESLPSRLRNTILVVSSLSSSSYHGILPMSFLFDYFSSASSTKTLDVIAYPHHRRSAITSPFRHHFPPPSSILSDLAFAKR
jgi:hypothetical protein